MPSRFTGSPGNGQTLSFDDWMEAVNAVLLEKIFMTAGELPDYAYRDSYDAGADPADIALDVMAENEWPLGDLDEDFSDTVAPTSSFLSRTVAADREPMFRRDGSPY